MWALTITDEIIKEQQEEISKLTKALEYSKEEIKRLRETIKIYNERIEEK